MVRARRTNQSLTGVVYRAPDRLTREWHVDVGHPKHRERVAPEYAVDVYAKPQSVRERIVGVLRREYDVIQVDETVRNGVVGALVASRRNVPLVAYVRGWADYTNAHGQHTLARHTSIVARSRWVFGRSAKVLFVSEACRRVMAREYGINGGRVVGRQFDTDRFASFPVKSTIGRHKFLQ